MKKRNTLELVGLIINIILTAAFTIIILIETNKLINNYSQKSEIIILLIALIILYLGMHLQLILHEIGHLIFGLISGYKFSSFRIGNIMLIKQKNKLKIKIFKVAGTSGQCIMTPPELANNKIPVLLYNFGGAIFNILFAMLFIAIYFIFQNNNIINYMVKILAIYGIYFAALNGIPMKMGTIDNDGFNALSLNKNEEAQKAFWTQLKINEMLAKNKRVKEMPEEWFNLDKDADLKNSIVATIEVYNCNRLMDEHEFKKANKKMEKLLKQENAIAGIYQNLMICDRIYCELIEKNFEAANKLYNNEQKKFMKSMENHPSIIRTNYAISLLLEKDQAKANKFLKSFRKRIKSYPYPSDIKSERELISIATTINKN